MLRSITIVQNIVVSIVVFSLALMGFAWLAISQTWSHLTSEQQDYELIYVMKAIENVAFEFAKERGLSAVYLSSNNNPDRFQKVKQQRIQADKTIAKIEEINRKDWPAELQLNAHLRILIKQLNKVSKFRSKVDTGDAPRVFAQYTELNKVALDVGQILRKNIADQNLQQGLIVAFDFANYKENMGQLRGIMAKVFNTRELGISERDKVTELGHHLSVIESYVEVLASDKLKNEFEMVRGSSISEEVRKIYEQVAEAPLGEIDDSFPTGFEWFDLATRKIADYKTMLNHEWEYLLEDSREAQDHARFLLIVDFIALAAILLVIGLLNYSLIISLRVKLNVLTTILGKVAKEGDLTCKVRLESADELGHISKAVQHMIDSFKDLIVGLANSIDVSSLLGKKLNTVSQQVVKDAEKTETMATNIATSVEEMASTSQEIARSAASTLDASDELNTFANRSFQINEQTLNSMEELTNNMSQVEQKSGFMAQQVSDISEILEAINQVSEQTNLLALNAAIEAARAGEQGRGFAVVADEVRTLAKSSKQSSDRISQMLNGLQSASSEVEDAVKSSTENAQQTLIQAENSQSLSDELKEKAVSVEQLSTQVAAAAEQQSIVVKEIASDTESVLKAATDELEAAKEMYDIFTDLEVNGTTMSNTMKHFKID